MNLPLGIQKSGRPDGAAALFEGRIFEENLLSGFLL